MSRKAAVDFAKVDELFACLLRINPNRTFSKIQYEQVKQSSNKQDMKLLIGNRSADDWDSFKNAMIENLSQFGIVFTKYQGGALAFSGLQLGGKLGQDVAEGLLKTSAKTINGDIWDLIWPKIPNAKNYIDSDKLLIDISDFREGFKSIIKDNCSFRFKQGRNTSKYYKATNEFIYTNTSGKQDELELGEKILPDLRDLTGIDLLVHTQSDRTGSKYLNYDFIGYDKLSTMISDDLDIYAFELKATNKVASISEAISQATNYKSTANYVYIVIPMFDKKLFYDQERFQSYFDICNDNGIGIITIDFGNEPNASWDVYEILQPTRSTTVDSALQEYIMDEYHLEYCPLCRRIVHIDDNEKKRIGCKWLSANNNKCMKLVFEEQLDPISH